MFNLPVLQMHTIQNIRMQKLNILHNPLPVLTKYRSKIMIDCLSTYTEIGKYIRECRKQESFAHVSYKSQLNNA